jgi:hypothetical protein
MRFLMKPAALAVALSVMGPVFAQGTSPGPGLGEIMSLQQMRHAKLWMAGKAKNWPLAAYELDELREGFDDAARFHASDEGVPIAQMIAALTSGPIDALSSAIEHEDAKGFAKSFDGLTAACNACHAGAKHGFIRIRRPSASSYGNQDFAPQSPR